MSYRETRECPNGHVSYTVNPEVTYIDKIPHTEKNFCPVCGEKLKIDRYEVPDTIYTKEDHTEG